MIKKIEPGQQYKCVSVDKTLTVLSIEPGSVDDQHPQIFYAKCRFERQSGEMGLSYVAVHHLISSHYHPVKS